MYIIILFEMFMLCNYSDNDAIIKVYNYRETSYEIEFEVHGAKGASIHATFSNELFLYTCTMYI